jgi:hypothetical protein
MGSAAVILLRRNVQVRQRTDKASTARFLLLAVLCLPSLIARGLRQTVHFCITVKLCLTLPNQFHCFVSRMPLHDLSPNCLP